MKSPTFSATRKALRQTKRAMIGNLLFGPVEAIPLRSTNTHVSFKRCDNGKVITFARKDIGESVFVEYFIP